LADTISEHIKIIIRREMNEVADHLAVGGCLSTGEDGTLTVDKIAVEYARNVGRIEGLATLEREILDIEARQEEAERQDK
jgi:hypothetical protein